MDERSERRSWPEQEFSSINLGDKRLSLRLIKTAEHCLNQPLCPINQACESWADTKAAYRLFANKKVAPEEILAPHRERTVERISAFKQVFSIQDTTYLNYTSHPKTKGLGHIGTAHQKHVQGLIMHHALAVSPTGVPLGLLHQETYSRAKKSKNKKASQAHKRLPIEQKETHRW